MNARKFLALTVILLTLNLLSGIPLRAEKRPIDVQKSILRVHVSKSGFFSAFGHEHDVEAPIADGLFEDSNTPSVELHVEAGKLRVLDKDASAETREQIQKTMLGPEVLDAARFPGIYFRSTRVVRQGPDRWTVEGDLDLHGEKHPVQVSVTRADGTFHGSAIVKQRDFGITPVTVAGGSVKVKNEVRIEFEIAAKGR